MNTIQRMELPVPGTGATAVKIRFGGGELTVRPGRPSFLSGEFAGMPARQRQEAGVIEIEPESLSHWPWSDPSPSWVIALPTDVTLALEVESGATRTLLDLRTVRLASLRIATGASDTRVLLPQPAGQITVHAESGAASMTFVVPEGVAARVHGQMALGTIRVDEGRFPRSADGWESAAYAATPNRVEIGIEGGVGSAQVIGEG